MRFIPACAGNTDERRVQTRGRAVHPRVRGEHVTTTNGSQLVAGSSPRARGTPRQDSPAMPLRRFIPACAGNTGGLNTAPSGKTVHPRVRGEHIPAPSWTISENGSSPRARGTRGPDRRRRRLRRFIPACAGNTATVAEGLSRSPVHPRVRGEHVPRAGQFARNSGSSPRARGTQLQAVQLRGEVRFIPACAGNTTQLLRSSLARAVHPRVRGEHISTETRWSGRTGSSPRARGTPAALSGRPISDRFIPACAGNTAPMS